MLHGPKLNEQHSFAFHKMQLPFNLIEFLEFAI